MSAPIHTQYSAGYRWYVLCVLTLGYIFNFIDRQVMTILLEPIKAEFGATDTLMGLLTGLAFALFYATLGVPMARLADRWSRRNVLAISMAVWSGMTALCATATSFGQLALYRIGVGVGEAGGTPPSQSLLADIFPPAQRSLAQGVLASGTNIAVLVGLFGGALLADAYGWRNVFWIFGVPGVALAVLIRLTVREPVRETRVVEEDGSLWSAIQRISALPGFPAIALAVGMTAVSGYGLGVWSPSFMIRVHGLSLVDAGLYLGLIGVFGGILGTLLSAILVDRLAQQDARWQLRLPMIGVLISIPTQALFLLWPAEHVWMLGDRPFPVALVFMFFSAIFASFWIAPSYAAVQNLVPAHWRTQAAALLLFILNLLGMGLGPLVVGWLSDVYGGLGDVSIHYALLSSLIFCAAGAFAFSRAKDPYAQAVNAAARSVT
ncbi:MAG: MFS transporter [Gammaproteobacteria bacterium]|nr:MFS transporter [Gammaproteobacteria bacterium]